MFLLTMLNLRHPVPREIFSEMRNEMPACVAGILINNRTG